MRYCVFIVFCFCAGCHSITIDKIEGLWQLEEVNVDGMPRVSVSTFLEINPNNCFAVSRTTGDLSGIYDIRSEKITLQSRDKQWFNRTWEVVRYGNHLVLNAPGVRKIKLTFKKIKRIPDFQEFADGIMGKWELYEIRKEGKIQKLSNTWFNIHDNGHYSIGDPNGLLEQGNYVVNTRHKKIIFERDSTIWDAWFWGNRLRLNNDQLKMQYGLRKNRHLYSE
ncbi:MAG: hypothetical protein RIG77_08805 [Cyclobacteriaceae bacterium]